MFSRGNIVPNKLILILIPTSGAMKSEIHVKQVFSSFSAFKAQPGQDTYDDTNIVNLNDMKRGVFY